MDALLTAVVLLVLAGVAVLAWLAVGMTVWYSLLIWRERRRDGLTSERFLDILEGEARRR